MPEVRLEKVDGRLFSGCKGVACRKGFLWISSGQLEARMAGNQGAIASEVYFSDLEKKNRPRYTIALYFVYGLLSILEEDLYQFGMWL
jgi:hypothetical protein